MFTVAIQYPSFGPQHPPRLQAIVQGCPYPSARVVAMEMFRKDSDYDWDPVQTAAAPYERYTVMDCESAVGRRSGRLLRNAVWNSLDRIKPDVLVVNGWGHRESRHSLNWARSRGSRIVLLSDSAYEDAPRKWYKEMAKRWIVRGSRSAFVAGSPQARYTERLGIPRAHVFHPGSCVVDNDYWQAAVADALQNEDQLRQKLRLPRRYFLYVGRFISKKNVPFLVRAYAAYRREVGDKAFGLVLCGDGPEREDIVAEIRNAGEANIVTPGFAQINTLPIYYALASCFVMPSSHFEQWGLVANEAMASGLPVLVSNQCGCAEDLVHDSVNGYRFDPTNERQLAAQMSTLSRNEHQLARMRRLRVALSLSTPAASAPATFGKQSRRRRKAAMLGGTTVRPLQIIRNMEVVHQLRRSPQAAPSRLISVGSLAVLAFLGEGLLAKSNVPGVQIGFLTHMWVTTAFLAFLGFVSMNQRIAVRDQATSLEIARIRMVIVLLSTWSLCGCLLQTSFTMANVAFWLLWTANLLAAWWFVPIILRQMDAKVRVRLVLLVILAVTVACAALHPINGYVQGRFVGMFVNATYSGRILALATVTWFTVWLTSGRRQFALLMLVALSGILLTMTRTRASIAACAVGCIAVFLTVQLAKTGWSQSSSRRKAAIAAVVAVFAMVVVYQFADRANAASFLRVDGGVRRVFASRTMNWSRGYADFSSYGVFGQGFMSRFGDTTNTVSILGVDVPRYNWQLAADPLNMWMSMAQQSGIPAMLLLALFVIAIWKLRSRTTDFQSRCLITGFLVTGLVFGTFDGNWLLSFGDPIDRLCMVVFAILGTAAHRTNDVRAAGPSRSRRARLAG